MKPRWILILALCGCNQAEIVQSGGGDADGDFIAGDPTTGDVAGDSFTGGDGGDDGNLSDDGGGDTAPGDAGDATAGDADAGDGDAAPGDVGAGDAVAGDPELLDPNAFTICSLEAQPWGASPSYVYRCVTPCPDQEDLSSCSWDSTTETGYPSSSLDFAVEGMGGTLRYADNDGPTALFHKGEKGTGWIPNTYLRDRLQAAGGRPVEVSWEADDLTGWFTRPDEATPSNLEVVSRRPAAVIAWVHEKFSAGNTFGTVGCSGGSMATYYARYWNPIDPILDYQLFMGGPPLASSFWACEGRWGCGSSGDQECGRCRLDVDSQCGVIDGCTLGSCSTYVLTVSARMIDQLHMTGTTCEDGGTDASYAASGHVTASGDSSFEHPVDFVVNTNVGIFGDDDIGIFAAAYEIYASTSGPRTWTVETGQHCDTQSSPASCEKMLSGLGLWTGAVGQCP